jgi:hypothetical protein
MRPDLQLGEEQGEAREEALGEEQEEEQGQEEALGEDKTL